MATKYIESQTVLRTLVYICDKCGKERGYMFHTICCGKHLCDDCRIQRDSHPLTGEMYSADYPENFCSECLSHIGNLSQVAQEEKDRHNEAMRAIVLEWRSRCKNNS